MKKSLKLYNVLTFLLGWLLKLLFRVKVTGKENENFEGSAIYCINHLSNWDPVIVACVTKRPINFIAKKELFEIPVLKNILDALGVYPIERGVNDLVALKTTLGILKDGGSICMFPQGTRHPGVDPRTTEVKSGIAMFERHAKSTVVPIGIYTKNYKIRLFKKVYVSIGKPMQYDDFNYEDNSREEYARVSGMIFDEICTLCENARDGK